ncbi:MAG: hypothetical protein Q8934_07195 [Bacillota bacterium]|nr:hypothetical protein [Bacillota bacterium]
MKRAIVVYLDYTNILLQQFACFYTSYKYSHCDENTDLVVFGPKISLDLVPEDCIKVELNPFEGIWKTYPYMNSVNCLGTKEAEFLKGYDYLLRSDIDTFLTPAWNSFFPDHYTVGGGGYTNTTEVVENIKRVAEKFNTKHQGIHNIGSTHYGPSSQVIEVCKLSQEVAYYLLAEEFKDDPGAWPSWYKGVTILYSTEIATNHLIDVVDIKPDQLDFHSTSTDSIHIHPHIHCWHTNDVFSKFAYFNGKYDHLVPNLHCDEVRQYCLNMALLAKKELPRLY